DVSVPGHANIVGDIRHQRHLLERTGCRVIPDPVVPVQNLDPRVRVLAGLCAAVALTVLFLRRRVEDRRGRLASALEDLVGERRRPGETLLEFVRRAAPFPDIENLVWRIYDVVFAGDGSVSDEKTVLRLIRDARRSRMTADSEL
ncbi:MAG: hypothetical protein NTZ77_05325, partial [Caldiserica bacterium]|nr:hypothetical protein [Caldisericota bacterium]